MPKTDPFSIRLDETVKRALEVFAENEKRSTSSAIELLVTEGLQRRQYLTTRRKLGKAVLDPEAD